MAGDVIGVRLSREDTAFIDEMAERNMSYRGTIARRLLTDKIAELRTAMEPVSQTKEGEEN